MKRIGAILTIALTMIVMVSGLAFADQAAKSFGVDSTYPKDGTKGTSIDNFGVKVYFTDAVGGDAAIANNKNCVVIKDSEGKKLPITLYYSSREKNLMMALVEPEDKAKVQQNTEYTVTISGDFQNAKGEALGKDYQLSFSTLNQKRSTTVNMVMMAVMFGGIMIFSAKSFSGDQKKDEENKKTGNDKVNPYKEAKKTGKSVEEVVAKDRKEKAKKAASEARRIHRDQLLKDKIKQQEEEEAELAERTGKHRVHSPRPISAGGSTYITGRKAAAEAAAKEAMLKGTTRPKNQSKKNHKK